MTPSTSQGDSSPIVVGTDSVSLSGFATTRFLAMGASQVFRPSGLPHEPQLLPRVIGEVRDHVGAQAPIVVATCRPDWAFGWLRLFHRLVDGVVLWGVGSPFPDPSQASAWERIFKFASRMDLAPGEVTSGLKVLVRLEPPALPHLSKALLEGRRRDHWEPLPGRWTTPSRVQVPAVEHYALSMRQWIEVDGRGLRVQETPPAAAHFLDRNPVEHQGPPVEERPQSRALLLAARRAAGDTSLSGEALSGSAVAEVEEHLQRWEGLAACERLLAARDEDGLRSLVSAPGGDGWKAGPVGLAAMAQLVNRPGDEAWLEQAIGRIAAATIPVRHDVPSSRPGLRRLVLHSSGIHGFSHAPTRVVFSMVEGLLRSDPSLEVLIVSEDCVFPSPEEDVVQAPRRPVPSLLNESDHHGWLRERGFADRVSIHYARTSESRAARTQRLLEAVDAFLPEVIVGYGTDMSIARVALFERYPYVAISSGGQPRSGRAHVYVPSLPVDEISRAWPAGLSRPGALRPLRLHVETAEPERDWVEADLGVGQDAVLLVTVGNRLQFELTDDFLSGMFELLRGDRRLHWILVGDDVRDLLAAWHGEEVMSRVRLHGFEKDLAGLLAVCDVYVNPFRNGGGVSVYMALKAGLAVLARGDSIDARSWVGDADEAWDAEGYWKRLATLCGDALERARCADRMLQRSLEFAPEQATTELLKLVAEAQSMAPGKPS